MFPILESFTSAPAPTVRSHPTGASQGQITTTATATTTIQAHRSNSLPHITRVQTPDGTLRLRGGPIHSRRVTWSEEVVDNEHLGRKKSKVCCIFKRNREFGESSDESSSSSDSDSSDDDSDIGDGKRKGRDDNRKKGCDKDHDHNHEHNYFYHHQEHRKPTQGHRRRAPSPNAYEKMPKNVTKKKETTSAAGGGERMT